MQISRSQSYLSLPLVPEAPRDRAVPENALQPVQPQGALERRATRAIEDIQSAQRMLNRQRAQTPYGSIAQEGRQQRAVAAYHSLQQSDERAYVSEVLGIDVYA
ncbi:MAG: hypothetical protein P8166_03950 [Candidatus Thiodiazotropha sp.]|jgi:hypothetical protein